MDSLKNTLIIILGIFIVSSFTANEKKELSNGEKNIELIKKLLEENNFVDVRIIYKRLSNITFSDKISPNEINFDDIYIIVKNDDDEKSYFEGGKILYIGTYKNKKGQHLRITLM